MNIPEGLYEAIEVERARLCRAEAMLSCMALALEYGEPGQASAPDYGEVVNMATELLRASINGLDSLNLERATVAGEARDPTLAAGP